MRRKRSLLYKVSAALLVAKSRYPPFRAMLDRFDAALLVAKSRYPPFRAMLSSSLDRPQRKMSADMAR
jgi:hypothetical protein